MATKAKTLKTSVHDTVAKNVLIERTEMVDVKDLKLFHKNPRVGNVDEIAKSLHLHSQFRPILVNIGTKTGRPNEILAGNHTYLGARRGVSWTTGSGKKKVDHVKEAWPEIYASFIDVDDEAATKIVLVDNKLADEGTYDEKILANLLNDLPDIEGTGFSDGELETLLDSIKIDEKEVAKSLDDIRASMPTLQMDDEVLSINERPRDERDDYLEYESEQERDNAINRGAPRTDYESDVDITQVEQADDAPSEDEKMAELQAILEVREEMLFRGKNFFEIPDLREDMLVTEFPDNIQTWAGREATPDDGEKWFWYNYGLGGAKGLPLDRAIMAFNTHDEKFQNWWESPAYYTAKMIAGGLRNAVCPDFSFYYTMPRFVHLQGVYQSQWLGRFMQEAGIKIIPRVQFDDERSLEFNTLGIPKNPPFLTCSVQNFGHEDKNKGEREAQIGAMLQKAVDLVEPTEGMIVYGGNPGRRVLDSLSLHGARPIWVENYAAVRRGTVFDKKDGLLALPAKERKALKAKVRAEEEARLGIKPKQAAVSEDDEFEEEEED